MKPAEVDKVVAETTKLLHIMVDHVKSCEGRIRDLDSSIALLYEENHKLSDAVLYIRNTSLRDDFAAAAVTGLLAFARSEDRSPQYLGKISYAIADGMLAERAKEGGACRTFEKPVTREFEV
jgi:hypothetical protein